MSVIFIKFSEQLQKKNGSLISFGIIWYMQREIIYEMRGVHLITIGIQLEVRCLSCAMDFLNGLEQQHVLRELVSKNLTITRRMYCKTDKATFTGIRMNQT